MAGTGYVLNLEDDLAGPVLELIRRLLQPSSRSRPHVTVVYLRSSLHDLGTRIYDNFSTEHVHLLGPGTFDSPEDSHEAVATLFIRVEASDWEYLHHKPDFPDSFFHISLYDGMPSRLAARAFVVLRRFEWDLDVLLPPTMLTRLQPRAAKRSTDRPFLSDAAKRILGLLTDLEPSQESFERSAESDRLRLIEDLCAYLHGNTTRVSRSPLRSSHVTEVPSQSRSLQEEFWPAFDFLDPDHRGSSRRAQRELERAGGVYLTPPQVAFDVTQAALSVYGDEDIAYGDPSLGSGIFLAALVRLAGEERLKSAVGVEEDPLRARLTAERWRNLGLDVAVDNFVQGILSDPSRESPALFDSAHEKPWKESRRSLILANPPYVRSQLLDHERTVDWARELKLRRKISVDVRSDFYVYFLLSAHDWMSEGAVAAWLLPTEFMFTRYGAAVRNYLANQVTLLQIHAYDGPSQFSNARVTSCVVLFRNTLPVAGHSARFSAGGPIGDPYVSSNVPVAKLNGIEKWHFLADDGAPEEPSSKAATNDVRIESIFRVRRGIATGGNKYFVVDDELADSFDAPTQWLKPVLPRARDLPSEVIEADGMRNPRLPSLRWLIDVDVPLAKVEKASPNLAAYLSAIESEATQGTIVGRRALFYKQEANEPPRFVFTYMAREQAIGNRFYLNRSRAVALNNYLVLEPRPEVAAVLDSDPQLELELLYALRSISSGEFARAGRVYVEGLTKVEPRELGRLRLVDVPEAIRRLVR